MRRPSLTRFVLAGTARTVCASRSCCGPCDSTTTCSRPSWPSLHYTLRSRRHQNDLASIIQPLFSIRTKPSPVSRPGRCPLTRATTRLFSPSPCLACKLYTMRRLGQSLTHNSLSTVAAFGLDLYIIKKDTRLGKFTLMTDPENKRAFSAQVYDEPKHSIEYKERSVSYPESTLLGHSNAESRGYGQPEEQFGSYDTSYTQATFRRQMRQSILPRWIYTTISFSPGNGTAAV